MPALPRAVLPCLLVVACALVALPAVGQALTGHYEGLGSFEAGNNMGEGTYYADLAADGTITGGIRSSDDYYAGGDGCTYSTQLDAIGVPQPDWFSDKSYVSMTGCRDPALNTGYWFELTVDTYDGAPRMLIYLVTANVYPPWTEIAVGMEQKAPATVGATACARNPDRDAVAGMWFDPEESGWGLSITVGAGCGQTVFAVLNIYSATGQPTWFVMARGGWMHKVQQVRGTLYATSGTPFYSGWDASSMKRRVTGSAEITFSSTTAGKLTYTALTPTGTIRKVEVPIRKQVF